MRHNTFLLLGLLLVSVGVTACRIGSNPSRSPIASSPYGAQVELTFSRLQGSPATAPDLTGWVELLAVTDSGLMVDNGTVIALVRFGSFTEAKLMNSPGVGTIKVLPKPEQLDKARRYSRYPFGLTDAQLGSLLAHRSQETLVIVGEPEG
ncbi:MAG: hypothetical protein MUO50_14455 [Longimicrobiales bacterium]|nr:hypothetical protein [Longimicrobiales bacterium]